MSVLLPLDAKHYMNNSISQYSQAAHLLELVDIGQDSSILDVGCGHGRVIAELAQIASERRAIGIDASKEMIRLAKDTFQGKTYKNLQFFHMNAESMNFPKSSFDLIVCTNVLMWIRNPQKALNLMISFLKRGGNIIIFTYPPTTPYALLFKEVLKDLFPDLWEKSAARTMMTPEEHKAILGINSMQINLFAVEDITFYYEDKDDFKNYVKGWLVCYAPLTEEEQEVFLIELCKKAYNKGYCSSNGRIAIPHQTLKIVATKSI